MDFVVKPSVKIPQTLDVSVCYLVKYVFKFRTVHSHGNGRPCAHALNMAVVDKLLLCQEDQIQVYRLGQYYTAAYCDMDHFFTAV